MQLQTLKEIEVTHIRAVLEALGGNLARTAQTLGIDRRTLYRKVRENKLGALVTRARRAAGRAP